MDRCPFFKRNNFEGCKYAYLLDDNIGYPEYVSLNGIVCLEHTGLIQALQAEVDLQKAGKLKVIM
jgi:hypothetical protein